MMLYKTIAFFLLILLSFGGAVSAFDTLYVDASLDTLRKEISGSVTWRLPVLPEIHSFEFQLFPNVYSSAGSPYLQGRENLRNLMRKSGKWGEMPVDSVFLDGRNITEIIQVYHTRAMFRPEEEMSLNGSAVKIFFRTRLPEMGDRLTSLGGRYFLDGWFPYPAVLNEDGSWYNPEYNSFSELVGDFYHFEVVLRLPENFKIAASVTPEIIETEDTLKDYRFSFGPAHDFALALDPEYMIDTAWFDDIEVVIYYRDFEQPVVDRIKTATGNAFEFMSDKVGPYQYPRLAFALIDIVEAGGIELPGFIALSSVRGRILSTRMLESLVIHEVIHQWFYGVINSDQIKSPWMDESITSFFTLKIMEQYWGIEANTLDFAGFEVTERDQLRPFSIASRHRGSLKRATGDFIDGSDYFGTVYSRGPLIVETFDNLLGDSLSNIFWRSYFERFKFKSPTSDDLVELAGEIAGENIQTTLLALIGAAGDIDYAVSDLENRQIDSITYESDFILGRKGTLDVPIDYQLILYTGDTLNYFWEPDYNSDKITIRLEAPVREIIIDPDHVIAVDDNLLNNSVLSETDSRPAFRLSSAVMYLVESLMSLLGGM